MLWLQSKCKTTWQKHVEWALFTRRFVSRFISLQDEWTKTVLERFSNPAVRDTIYRLNEDATNRIATCWAYMDFLQGRGISGCGQSDSNRFPTFQAVALAPCLHEAKLWVEFCVSFWVFFNRLAGCGATRKVFVQVGGGTRNQRGDIRRCSTWWCLAVQGINAFHCISMHFMLSWKDFDV